MEVRQCLVLQNVVPILNCSAEAAEANQACFMFMPLRYKRFPIYYWLEKTLLVGNMKVVLTEPSSFERTIYSVSFLNG